MPSEKAIISNSVINIEEVSGVRWHMAQNDLGKWVLSAYPHDPIPENWRPLGVVLSSDFDKQLTELGMLYAFAEALVNAQAETKGGK